MTFNPFDIEFIWAVLKAKFINLITVDYNKYKGKYISLVALAAAYPTANAGDYAIVDAGVGSAARQYIWDIETGWVDSGEIKVGTTTDQLTEGSTNLFFTTARAVAAITTTAIGTLINGANAKATPADGDSLGISDSEAGGVAKKLTFTDLALWIVAKLANVSGGLFGLVYVGVDSGAPPAADNTNKFAIFTNRGISGTSWWLMCSNGSVWDRAGGGPVAIDTWVNLQAYVTSAYIGCRFKCTDVGINGSFWTCTGTELVPDQPITLYRQTDAYARAPSGTINTGSSGNITFGTASPRAYTEGVWVYLPAIATTPAITAGYYWCVMSNTTTGTLYSSQGGAAINFTAGASYTGVTTRVDLLTTTIKGIVASYYKCLTLSGVAQANNNANVKSVSPFWGSHQLILQNLASGVSHKIDHSIFTVGSALQYCTPSGSFTSGDSTIFVNTNIDNTFTYSQTASGTTATDWIVLAAATLTLYPR